MCGFRLPVVCGAVHERSERLRVIAVVQQRRYAVHGLAPVFLAQMRVVFRHATVRPSQYRPDLLQRRAVHHEHGCHDMPHVVKPHRVRRRLGWMRLDVFGFQCVPDVGLLVLAERPAVLVRKAERRFLVAVHGWFPHDWDDVHHGVVVVLPVGVPCERYGNPARFARVALGVWHELPLSGSHVPVPLLPDEYGGFLGLAVVQMGDAVPLQPPDFARPQSERRRQRHAVADQILVHVVRREVEKPSSHCDALLDAFLVAASCGGLVFRLGDPPERALLKIAAFDAPSEELGHLRPDGLRPLAVVRVLACRPCLGDDAYAVIAGYLPDVLLHERREIAFERVLLPCERVRPVIARVQLVEIQLHVFGGRVGLFAVMILVACYGASQRPLPVADGLLPRLAVARDYLGRAVEPRRVSGYPYAACRAVEDGSVHAA